MATTTTVFDFHHGQEYTKAMSRLTDGADTGSLSAEAYQMMQRERDDALRQVKELKVWVMGPAPSYCIVLLDNV